MQIKIEIDVKPEELRRFLGLPDVGAAADDIVEFLREKVGEAAETAPGAFVKANLDTLRTLISKAVIKEATNSVSAKPTRRRKSAQ